MSSATSCAPSRSRSNGPSRRRHGGSRRGKLFTPKLFHLEQRLLLATDYWTGHSAATGGNDNWSNAGNWSTGAVPGTSDTADFTSSESQYGTSVVDLSFSIGSLVIDSTWGGTLDVNNALSVSGNFTLASGTLGGTATLTASGSSSEWSAGTLAGSVTNAGTMTIDTSGGSLFMNGTLTNTGTINVTGTNAIYTDVTGGTIDNQAGGTFDFQAGAAMEPFSSGTGIFNNAGTLENSISSGTSAIGFTVNDTGTIQGDSGTLELTDGGSGGSSASPGTMNAGTGATVIMGGTFSGAFQGSGAGAVDLSGFTGGSGGATLDFTGSVLQWVSTSVGNYLGGSVTNSGAMTIATSNGSMFLTGTLTNAGAVAVTGTNDIYTDVTGGTIDNQAGGTFDFQAGAAMEPYSSGTGIFNNAGTLERSTGSGTATINYTVNDTGTIQGNSGILQLVDGGSGGTSASPGTVNAGTGGTVIMGGTFSGAFQGSGAGAVDLSGFTGGSGGATLDFTGSVLQWVSTSVGNYLGGSVTTSGAMTIATSNGSMFLTGTLTNAGAVAVTGTNDIYTDVTGGTIDNQAGGTFDFQAGAAMEPYSSGTGIFNNAGTLERSTGSGTATINYTVNDTGTIQGNSGILQLVDGGSGGTSASPGTVNAGTGGTVIMGGTFSGAFQGSGAGAVDLSGFTGGSGGATLDFTGSVLQWADTSVGSFLGGSVSNSGAMTIATGPNSVFLSGTLTNTGAIAVTGTNGIYADVTDGTIDNQAGGTFDFQAGAAMEPYSSGTGIFNNAGTLERSTGSGTAVINYTVNNTGTIQGNSGTLELVDGGSGGTSASPATVNAGTSGTVILDGTFPGVFQGSGAGAVDLSGFSGGTGGATLDFTGSVLQWVSTSVGNALGGSVTNSGAMTIATGPNSVFLSGTLTNTGAIIVTGTNDVFADAPGATIDNQAGATFDFQAGVAMEPYSNGTGIFNNAGTLGCSSGSAIVTINYTVNNTGAIQDSAGNLQLVDGGTGSSGDTTTAAAGATVVLTGNFSGSFAGSGGGSVQLSNFTGSGSGVTLSFTGSVLECTGSLAGTVNNENMLTIPTGTDLPLTGTLTNNGTINFDTTNSVYANANGTTINNDVGGIFDIQAAGVLYSGESGTAFNNAGTLEWSTGAATAYVNFPVYDSGIVVGNSGTLQMMGGGSDTSGIPLAVQTSANLVLGGNYSGTFAAVGGGSVQLNGFTGSGTSGATFDIGGSILECTGGNLGGSINNEGNLLVSSNSVGLSGTLTNTGTITIAGNAGFDAVANNTTINNDSTGTIVLQAGASLYGDGYSNITFNNAGTLQASGGTASSYSDENLPYGGTGNVVVNSGTVSIDSGNLDFEGSQFLSIAPSAALDVAGNLIGGTINADQFAPDGTVMFDGSGTAAAPSSSKS